MNNISRPSVSIKRHPSGKHVVITLSAPSWQSNYSLTEQFPDENSATKTAKKFFKVFDQQASLMEAGKINRYNMLTAMVNHGILTREPKLSDAFADFVKS